ncbi:MAG: HD domain-containing protein [Clostridia bacterium]|nr:HD domain-containing protein [Clostridia bacterium]
MDLFNKAIAFAAEAHAGTRRKNTDTPYILHPLEVAAIAGTMTSDPEVLAAAVLHDTVEDTPTEPGEIRERFGERIAALVASETEDKRPGVPPEESWQIRKEESLEKLKNAADPGTKILWLSDKLSNMRSFARLRRREGDGLWARFNQKDPAGQAWYYRTVAAYTEELSDTDAWREYTDLIETVFEGVE